MNEASSKYVDQIAIEKLLREKLQPVRHAPNGLPFPDTTPLAELARPAPVPAVESTPLHTRRGLVMELAFDSPIRSAWEENNRVRCRFLPAAAPSASLILVHGLFEENFEIYNYFLAMLGQQGYDVYLMVLPYHYQRKPVDSFFSGEYFWSADLARSAWAVVQAMRDLHQLHAYVAAQGVRPVHVAGFSMGAAIVLGLAAAMPLDGAFVINPVCNMSDLVWNSALFSTVRRDLAAAGLGLADVQRVFAAYEPLNAAGPATPPQRVALARGVWDQINEEANYERLLRAWRMEHAFDYKAGHLNILRVPRLAADLRGALEDGAP